MALRPANEDPRSRFAIQHHALLRGLRGLVPHNLWQHQVDAIMEARRALEAAEIAHAPFPRIELVVLPQGCGKSGVAVLAPYILNSHRALVLTPSKIVMQQIALDFQHDVRFGNEPFLQRRGIFPEESRARWAPTTAAIERSAQIPGAAQQELVVINYSKLTDAARFTVEDLPQDFDLVIVDEAHHYPAPTWTRIVHHFQDLHARILFLTATPYHNAVNNPHGYILANKPPCYSLSRARAIEMGIIRPIGFDEVPNVPGNNREQQIEAVVQRMMARLNEHDTVDPAIRHQAMILSGNAPDPGAIVEVWNRVARQNECAPYIDGTSREVLNDFKNGNLRALVVIARLTEGFDQPSVSVVGILRSVSPRARVNFEQFVGRAFRRTRPDEPPLVARCVSHACHGQADNFDRLFREDYPRLADEDPEDNN